MTPSAPWSSVASAVTGTIIASGLEVEGDLQSDEPITLGGALRGKLGCSDQVTILDGGRASADIEAHSLVLEGEVTGNVVASDRVELRPGGRLIGDVRAGRLTIADGAIFNGNVDMDT